MAKDSRKLNSAFVGGPSKYDSQSGINKADRMGSDRGLHNQHRTIHTTRTESDRRRERKQYTCNWAPVSAIGNGGTTGAQLGMEHMFSGWNLEGWKDQLDDENDAEIPQGSNQEMEETRTLDVRRSNRGDWTRAREERLRCWQASLRT